MAENIYVSGYLTVTREGDPEKVGYLENDIPDWCRKRGADPGVLFPSVRTDFEERSQTFIVYYGDNISKSDLSGFDGEDVSEKLTKFFEEFSEDFSLSTVSGPVSGHMTVDGYVAGSIDIFENDVIFTEDDGASADWKDDRLDWEFRRSVRAYFSDKTEEGRIDKSARMEEAARILHMIADYSREYISQIYDEEYSRFYHKKAVQ